ncbi:MAG TPA: hypothetical protein VLX68_15755 [Chitinivibrionales bacterium]|nr:hypothetical protein [Chitinivibrionales bacterium]
MTPADKEAYEKLGLSETEWNKIKDANLPLSKVHEIMASGITVSEYFRYPWKELFISEEDYIKLRRAGNSDAEVRERISQKRTINAGSAVQSFFIPGFNQIRRDQPVRGWLMVAVAAGSLGLLAAQNYRSARFQPLGLCLLVPDLLWSGIDMSVQVARQKRQGAALFVPEDIGMRFCFSF